MARQQKCSLEEMARRYRYDCFEQAVREQKLDKIAVAHHQDDQAETILFQMMRGSGLRGMGGMKGISGHLVRPLLPLRRQDIRQALEEMGQTWCEDSTNRETVYSRNRIRSRVMPLLEQDVNAASTEHIARCGEQFQWVQQFLEQELDKRMEEIVAKTIPGGRVLLWAERVVELPRALQMELAYRMLTAQAGHSRDITFTHLESLLSLAKGETGRRCDFPYGITAGKDYDILWLEKLPSEAEEDLSVSCFRWEKTRSVPLEIKVPAMESGDICITLSREDYRKSLLSQNGKIPKNICTKWFEYATINGTLEFRHPQTGDFFWLDEARTKRKLLSRLMIDSHIPREQRERLWVLAQEHSVLWIPELGRQSTAYYVSRKTEEILCCTLAAWRDKG
jgi:tRNA(Ile)-lysidine synthase